MSTAVATPRHLAQPKPYVPKHGHGGFFGWEQGIRTDSLGITDGFFDNLETARRAAEVTDDSQLADRLDRISSQQIALSCQILGVVVKVARGHDGDLDEHRVKAAANLLASSDCQELLEGQLPGVADVISAAIYAYDDALREPEYLRDAEISRLDVCLRAVQGADPKAKRLLGSFVTFVCDLPVMPISETVAAPHATG